MRITITFTTLVFICLSLYLESVELKSSKRKRSKEPRSTISSSSVDSSASSNSSSADSSASSNSSSTGSSASSISSESSVTTSTQSKVLSTTNYMYCCPNLCPKVSCPDGWFMNRTSCYYFVNTPVNWDTAVLQCQTLNSNAYLVEIADAEENTVVYRISSYSDVWIGLTDSTTEGTFIWITSGDTPIYIPLGYIYYPYTDSRDCVFMHYTHWDAGYCYNARPFVCELPLGL